MISDVESEFEYFLKEARNTLVIDTNVLLLFLAGNIGSEHIKRINRVKKYSKEDYHTLIRILDKFKKVIVTPNVLTEISNLMNKQDYYRGRIFQELIKVMSKNILEEEFIESQNVLLDNSVYRFGITDIGSSKLQGNNSYGVITADDPLCEELKIKGIPVLNFNHLKI